MFEGVVLIGGSASVGKTTLAASLLETLGAGDVVHLDEVRGEAPGVVHHLDRAGVWDSEPAVLLGLLLEETASLRPTLVRLVGQLREKGGGAIVEGEGVEPDVVDAFAEDPHLRAAYVIETDAEVLRRTLPLALRRRAFSLSPHHSRTAS